MNATDAKTYEVEQKFCVQGFGSLETSLLSLGAEPLTTVEQVDTYFAHPARNFAETDEAFRLRQVGVENFVTYKGPKVDATTKTRREIELSLPEGTDYAAQFRSLLEALGFRVVADVSKVRRATQLAWEEATIEVSLDDVAKIGTYVELEMVVPESEVSTARERIARLASELRLQRNERRSYLDLLLHREPAHGEAVN